jgi:hypothetical protein
VHLLEKAFIPRALGTGLLPPCVESSFSLGLEAGVFRGCLRGPVKDEQVSVLQRVGERCVGCQIGADG